MFLDWNVARTPAHFISNCRSPIGMLRGWSLHKVPRSQACDSLCQLWLGAGFPDFQICHGQDTCTRIFNLMITCCGSESRTQSGHSDRQQQELQEPLCRQQHATSDGRICSDNSIVNNYNAPPRFSYTVSLVQKLYKRLYR